MTTTPVTERLRSTVAEEVRVLLARRRMSGVKLAAAIGRTQAYVSRRLTGEVAFDIDDLEAIASALEVDVTDLLPSKWRGGTDNIRSGRATNRPPDNRPSGRVKTKTPNVASAERPASRRPQRLGSITRPMSQRAA